MSVNPLTRERYCTTFPVISVQDMVNAQFLLLDSLGIDKVRRFHRVSMIYPRKK